MTIYNHEKMILEAQAEFKGILDYVQGEAQEQQLHEVERGIFRRLLLLGLKLLQLFFTVRGTGYRGKAIKNREGMRLGYHSDKTRGYFSIFGKLNISRAYYWEKDKGGCCPLDGVLNLAENGYSYLLAEWADLLGVRGVYDKVTQTLEKLLRIKLWKRPVEELVRKASSGVNEYYKKAPVPSPKTEGDILVTSIDGKGVPMIRQEPAEKKVRLNKGDKKSKKKEAVVTTVYTLERCPRSVEDIVEEVMEDGASQGERKKLERPKPRNKRVRATLRGKDAAFEELAREVKRRDPKGEKDKVVIMDAGAGLINKARNYLKGFTIILDLFHVLEYLWKGAHIFHREGSIEAQEWVTERLIKLLTGNAGYVIGGLKQSLKKRGKGLSKKKRERLEGVIRYLERGRRYMRYDEYLAKGYPIGSGVVEGACRHLVKDRMELSGMRWSIEGAEAVLQLRSVDINGDWEEYWEYWVSKERERLYGKKILPEGSRKAA